MINLPPELQYLESLSTTYKAAKAKRKQARRAAKPTAFQQKYLNAPGLFVQDCFLWTVEEEPAPYQLETLEAIPTYRKVSERGPHGIGKSATASWAILWFALTRDGHTDWKIPITASVWNQLKRFLFPELHKWARRLDWSIIGRGAFREPDELQIQSLRLKTGEAFGIVSDQPSSIEGAHASEMLYILDESKAIPKPFWEAVEGAFASGQCYALALSTPGSTTGVFYSINRHALGYEDWHPLHVTSEEAIAAGRMLPEWREQRRKQWGEKSPVFLNRVEGEFSEGGTDQLIPLAWVDLANLRYLDMTDDPLLLAGKIDQVGCDVARYGDDATVIVRRKQNLILPLSIHEHQDTMRTVGNLILTIGADNDKIPMCIDVGGLGVGVYDRLNEQKYKVYGVNSAESAKDINGKPLTDKSGELQFVNIRSYLWWLLRERLDPDGTDPLGIPSDDPEDDRSLTGDITDVKWGVTSSGRIYVESKDEMKVRLGHSPDAADAVALSLIPIELLFKRKKLMF